MTGTREDPTGVEPDGPASLDSDERTGVERDPEAAGDPVPSADRLSNRPLGAAVGVAAAVAAVAVFAVTRTAWGTPFSPMLLTPVGSPPTYLAVVGLAVSAAGLWTGARALPEDYSVPWLAAAWALLFAAAVGAVLIGVGATVAYEVGFVVAAALVVVLSVTGAVAEPSVASAVAPLVSALGALLVAGLWGIGTHEVPIETYVDELEDGEEDGGDAADGPPGEDPGRDLGE